jgi:hypothetical protein
MFECPNCEHRQKMLVDDPLKSANAGWTQVGFSRRSEVRRHAGFA